jgi:hypothetical protein
MQTEGAAPHALMRDIFPCTIMFKGNLSKVDKPCLHDGVVKIGELR